MIVLFIRGLLRFSSVSVIYLEDLEGVKGLFFDFDDDGSSSIIEKLLNLGDFIEVQSEIVKFKLIQQNEIENIFLIFKVYIIMTNKYGFIIFLFLIFDIECKLIF